MAPPRISPAVRLAARSERVGDCLIWQGAKTRDGYGVMTIGRNQQHRVHRVAYELARGPIPVGMVICHRCDTPLCVEVDHLFVGTPADNAADKVLKGRQVNVSGADHHAIKILPSERATIRARRAAGEKLKAIARDYGVAFQTISSICHRENTNGSR